MAIKFDKVKPGNVYYSRERGRMGNTTLRTIREFEVRILTVDAEKRTALCSWNGNRAETYYERDFSNLYDWSMRNPEVAEVTKGIWGSVVKVTKKKKTAKKVTP